MKRGLGEEFALPYPNIRTKEGYVMKKRVLALALSLVVVVSVSARGSELKEPETDKPTETTVEEKKEEPKTEEVKTIEGICEAISNTSSPGNSISQFLWGGSGYVADITDTNKGTIVGSFLISSERLYYQSKGMISGGIYIMDYFPSMLKYLDFSEEQIETISSLYYYVGLPGSMKILDIGGYRFTCTISEEHGYCLLAQPAANEEDYVEGQITEYDGTNYTTNETTGQQNALGSAANYLNTMAFSKSGLIDQLEYEGYSTEEATYAVENCGADWNEQAAKSAQNYINTMSFSRSGLIDQLIYEGFTQEQAEYGVSAVGY